MCACPHINVRRSSHKFAHQSWQVLITFEFSRHIFGKSQNKFHENPSCGSRVVPCVRTDGQADGQTWKKLKVALCNYAEAPKNDSWKSESTLRTYLLSYLLTYLLTPWNGVILGKTKRFSASQEEPATCPYPEPDQSSPCTHPTSWRPISTK
jgi:hypothetical protein